MRYFFNIQGEPFEDDTGVELPDIAAVRQHAVTHAADILSDHSIAASLPDRFEVRVTDASGAAVLKLEFLATEALSAAGAGRPQS